MIFIYLSSIDDRGMREIGVGGDNQNGPKTLDVPLSFFDLVVSVLFRNLKKKKKKSYF